MSGIEFLLDTNMVIGLLRGSAPAVELKKTLAIGDQGNAVSQISRMELLGFSALSQTDEARIQEFLSFCEVLLIDAAVEAETIALRRRARLKLPDAIIAATASVHGLRLVTLDQRLRSVYPA